MTAMFIFLIGPLFALALIILKHRQAIWKWLSVSETGKGKRLRESLRKPEQENTDDGQ